MSGTVADRPVTQKKPSYIQSCSPHPCVPYPLLSFIIKFWILVLKSMQIHTLRKKNNTWGNSHTEKLRTVVFCMWWHLYFTLLFLHWLYNAPTLEGWAKGQVVFCKENFVFTPLFKFYFTSHHIWMMGIDLIILLWHISVSIKLEPLIILKAMVPQRSFISVITVSVRDMRLGQPVGKLRKNCCLPLARYFRDSSSRALRLLSGKPIEEDGTCHKTRG